MIIGMTLALLIAQDLDIPRRPDLGLEWRQVQLLGANEMKIRPEYTQDVPRWVRLYGIDVPNASNKGYSGARQDLEILLGRSADVWCEDEHKDHPILRNASYVQFVWTRGKLIQFEMLRDGWASINDEGRSSRYSKYLLRAEDEAKRLHAGIWSWTKS